ncbi:MAG TPA: universal stress protein [Herpetosiphonaceae bacterium]
MFRSIPAPIVGTVPVFVGDTERYPLNMERPQKTFQRILIPLDGSALAEQIVAPALKLGRPLETEYTLLHVVEPAEPVWWGPFTSPRDPAWDETRRRLMKAQCYLARVARPLLSAGMRVRIRVLMAEQAAPAILSEAQHSGFDLIALATHGRSGLARLLLGSVADTILHRAKTPLLLYRPASSHQRVGYLKAFAAVVIPCLMRHAAV